MEHHFIREKSYLHVYVPLNILAKFYANKDNGNKA